MPPRYEVADVFVVVGAVILVAMSTAMNAHFGASWEGAGESAMMLAAVLVGMDLLKVAAGHKLVRRLQARRWDAVVPLAFLMVAVPVSAVSGLGFLKSLQSEGVRVGETAVEQRNSLTRELERAETALSELPLTRSRDELDAAASVLTLNPIWDRTRQCTNATLDTSIEFCREYRELAVERARADRIKQLELTISVTRNALADLPGNAAARHQSDAIHQLTGVSEEGALRFVIIITLIGVELGAALGLTLIGRNETPRAARTAVSPPVDSISPPIEAAPPAPAPLHAIETPEPDAQPAARRPMPPAHLRATLAHLEALAKAAKGGVITATQGDLSKGAKTSKATISRHLRELAEAGFIQKSADGTGTVIELLY